VSSADVVTHLWIAVPAAIGSALSFGMTGALQHTAAMRVEERKALNPGLLIDLGKQPIWLLSLFANALGTILQLVALATGPLVLVQPMLVSGLLFAVMIRSRLAHRRPPLYAIVGASLCAAGLAVFLLLSRPSGGHEWLSLSQALPLAAGLAAVLAICLGIASRFPGEPRSFALAAGAGVLYGVTAGVAKLAIGLFETQGIVALVTSWPLYAAAILGPMGFLLNQNAYQADRKMAPALAIITVTDPLVGIGVGVLWLGENLQSGLGPIIGQVLALAGLVYGVALLAHGAPQVLHSKSQPESSSEPV
jgi:drug/metabolite transporter (DMT)-like permease